MSVTPGKGGQKFLDNTKDRLQNQISFKKDNDFEIYVDGGINDETIKEVLNADGVISGSFICMNKDFENQIMKLKNSITQQNLLSFYVAYVKISFLCCFRCKQVLLLNIV